MIEYVYTWLQLLSFPFQKRKTKQNIIASVSYFFSESSCTIVIPYNFNLCSGKFIKFIPYITCVIIYILVLVFKPLKQLLIPLWYC